MLRKKTDPSPLFFEVLRLACVCWGVQLPLFSCQSSGLLPWMFSLRRSKKYSALPDPEGHIHGTEPCECHRMSCCFFLLETAGCFYKPAVWSLGCSRKHKSFLGNDHWHWAWSTDAQSDPYIVSPLGKLRSRDVFTLHIRGIPVKTFLFPFFGRHMHWY